MEELEALEAENEGQNDENEGENQQIITQI